MPHHFFLDNISNLLNNDVIMYNLIVIIVWPMFGFISPVAYLILFLLHLAWDK